MNNAVIFLLSIFFFLIFPRTYVLVPSRLTKELDRWHLVPYARWKSTYPERCQTITSRVRKPASLAPFGHISDAKDFASSFWFFLIRDNGGIFNFNFFFFKTSFFLKEKSNYRSFLSPRRKNSPKGWYVLMLAIDEYSHWK